MPDFTINRQRREDAENIIIQFLRDAGYQGSVEDGTGLSDTVIKPMSVIRTLLGQLVDRAGAYQSLQKAYELRSEIGEEEFDAAVDCILSNWFVTRNDGKPSRGSVRLWFLEPVDFIHYTDGQAVGTVDGISLVADGEQVYTQESFSNILNTSENQNEYYLDIAVRTRSNSTAAPSDISNASVSVPFSDIYYLRATIPGEFIPGELVESSDAFIRRTEWAITTRELITARAINTVLLDTFPDIIRLYVARHGSKEQLRDIIVYEGALVHYGNKADIYLSTTPSRQSLEVQADENGFIDPVQLPAGTSVICYIGAYQNVEIEPDIFEKVPHNLQITCSETHWCSRSYKPESIRVDTSGTVILDILTDNVLGQVHDFVNSESQRVACYDPLVKHAFIVLVYPKLRVELVDKKVDSTRAIKAAVREYVDYLTQNAEPWVASELVASVHVRVPNVKKIYLPLECQGVIYDPLTQENHVLDIGNQFTIGNEYTQGHSKQITDNTTQFYTDAAMIEVVSDFAGA